MVTCRRQLWALLAVFGFLAALPAAADSMSRYHEMTTDPVAAGYCPPDLRAVPLTPDRISMNIADCLSAFDPTVGPVGAGPIERLALPADATGTSGLQSPTTWLLVAGLGMMVLAGFNSRKRRRPLLAHSQFPYRETNGYEHSNGRENGHEYRKEGAVDD